MVPLTGSESHQPETAQDAYKALLRTRIAPRLRTLGFKGSGNSFAIAKGDYGVGINFQKNKWSTRDSVTFDVNLSVGHQANNESFQRENVVARQLGKEIEVPTSGNFFTRLSQLGEPKGNFPWTVTPGSPIDEVARDVVEAIQLYFMPKVEEELGVLWKRQRQQRNGPTEPRSRRETNRPGRGTEKHWSRLASAMCGESTPRQRHTDCPRPPDWWDGGSEVGRVTGRFRPPRTQKRRGRSRRKEPRGPKMPSIKRLGDEIVKPSKQSGLPR